MTDKANTQRIVVNFDAMREVAHRGVRRAALFLGLGLNAAYDKTYKEYQLTKIAQIDFIPSGADDKEITAYKDEFSVWIIGNGLRELVETFDTFLDRLYEGCLLFQLAKGQYSRQQLKAKYKAFHYVGLSEKLVVLKQEFALEPNNPDQMISINKARNCLTHRQGIIGKPDLGTGDTFHLKWMGMDTFVKTPNGEEIPLIPNDSREGIQLENGGTVMLRFMERSRAFSNGERIILKPRELAEMCQLFFHEANLLCNGGMEYSKKLGIINLKEEPPPSAPATS